MVAIWGSVAALIGTIASNPPTKYYVYVINHSYYDSFDISAHNGNAGTVIPYSHKNDVEPGEMKSLSCECEGCSAKHCDVEACEDFTGSDQRCKRADERFIDFERVEPGQFLHVFENEEYKITDYEKNQIRIRVKTGLDTELDVEANPANELDKGSAFLNSFYALIGGTIPPTFNWHVDFYCETVWEQKCEVKFTVGDEEFTVSVTEDSCFEVIEIYNNVPGVGSVPGYLAADCDTGARKHLRH